MYRSNRRQIIKVKLNSESSLNNNHYNFKADFIIDSNAMKLSIIHGR